MTLGATRKGHATKVRRLFLGCALFLSCAANENAAQETSSVAPVEGAGAGLEEPLAENPLAGDPLAEHAVADTWGRITATPPEMFFAADLSDDVRYGLTETLLAATAEWGNYGPLEYWVLGTDAGAAEELTDLFSQRRLELGHWEEADRLRHQAATGIDHGFESYRKVSADAVAQEIPSGSMGWNGNRDWGIHFYTSSYPLGFDSRFGASPGGEQVTVFHEYFHAVQQAHIQSRDHDERVRLAGPMWFVEGGAEYMAQTTARRLWITGELPSFDEDGLGSLEQSFEQKMRNGKETIARACPGVALGEITYDSECAPAGYDLGCWAIAYLLNQEGQEALIGTFYPMLNERGWEGAFEESFGMSSEDFYAVFETFLQQPLADQLAILPKYE